VVGVREARREANTRSILDALEQLLVIRPYGAIRVEDVMQVAGMTRTAFYRYFPDLEAVLLAWLVELRAEFFEAANLWLLPDADPEGAILPATTGLAEVWARHRRLLGAVADANTSGSRVQAAWHQLVEGFIGPVEQRLEAIAAQRPAVLEYPAETARALVWMNERYLLETYTRDRDVPVEVAGATLAQIWQGLLFSGGR
jgi:TetR/AcrR family transcriptional regulator, ethionamide resistance regulator